MGSQVIVKVEASGALHVTSHSQALASVRAEIRKSIPPPQDLAAELIRDRQAELSLETREPARS